MTIPTASDAVKCCSPFVLGRSGMLMRIGLWIGLAAPGLVIGWLAFEVGKQIAANQNRPLLIIILQITPAQ